MSDLGYLENCLNSINEFFKCRECTQEFETHSKALKHVVNEHGDVKLEQQKDYDGGEA